MKATIHRGLKGANIWLGLLCCALGACSGGSDQAENPTTPTAAKPTGMTAAATNPLASMVKAVAITAGEQPFELRFELGARPEAGKPIAIKLNLLGLAEAKSLQLTVQIDPKVQILEGAQGSFPAIKVGESVEHSLSVRSTETGIFVADVQVVASIGGQPRTLNYSIPIAVAPVDSGNSAVSISSKPAGG